MSVVIDEAEKDISLFYAAYIVRKTFGKEKNFLFGIPDIFSSFISSRY